MNDAERTQWKAEGLLPQKQEGYFVVRLRLAGGAASPRMLKVAAQVADTWGRGEVHLTTRQGLEIPWIAEGRAKERLARVIHRAGWETFLDACQLRTPR